MPDRCESQDALTRRGRFVGNRPPPAPQPDRLRSAWLLTQRRYRRARTLRARFLQEPLDIRRELLAELLVIDAAGRTGEARVCGLHLAVAPEEQRRRPGVQVDGLRHLV